MEDSLNRAIVSQRLQPCEPLKEYQTPTFNPILWVILEIDFPIPSHSPPLQIPNTRIGTVPDTLSHRNSRSDPSLPAQPRDDVGAWRKPEFSDDDTAVPPHHMFQLRAICYSIKYGLQPTHYSQCKSQRY